MVGSDHEDEPEGHSAVTEQLILADRGTGVLSEDSPNRACRWRHHRNGFVTAHQGLSSEPAIPPSPLSRMICFTSCRVTFNGTPAPRSPSSSIGTTPTWIERPKDGVHSGVRCQL